MNFEDEAIREIARMAFQLNKTVENIGARRLHTVMERIMENISFEAAEMESGAVRSRNNKCLEGSMFLVSAVFLQSVLFSIVLNFKTWQEVKVTKELVLERLKDVTMKADVSRYIL